MTQVVSNLFAAISEKSFHKKRRECEKHFRLNKRNGYFDSAMTYQKQVLSLLNSQIMAAKIF